MPEKPVQAKKFQVIIIGEPRDSSDAVVPANFISKNILQTSSPTTTKLQVYEVNADLTYLPETSRYFQRVNEIVLTIPSFGETIPEITGNACEWIETIAQLNQSAHVCLCINKDLIGPDFEASALLALAEEKGIDIESIDITSKNIKNLGTYLRERIELFKNVEENITNENIKNLGTYLRERIELFKNVEENASQALPASSDEEEQTIYPPKYDQIWNGAGKNITGEAQNIAKIKALLANYTMGIGERGYLGAFIRFFHGHPNRHHCEPVYEILRKQFNFAQEIMNELAKIKIDNPHGDLNKRINFILEKLPGLTYSPDNTQQATTSL